jgi:CubicO group peptidase (beta-lactamase class C family)
MLKTILKQIGFLILLVGLSASCSESIFPSTLETRVDKYIQLYHNNFGGVIFVAQKGKVLISKGYGLANRELEVPNTPQIKYAIGSMTKAFTAMGIMILQERGQLLVQDPICNYLADCPAAWKLITLHHLLTHTSGIHNFTDLFSALKDEVNICREYKPEAVITYFKDLPLDFAPGSGWNYSNSGYFLLGVVIEKVSGESYETFIQKNILHPLGMSESGYDRSSVIVKNRASGYSIDRPYYDIVNAPCYDVSLKFAHGGLFSTVGDLYKWDQALYTDQLVSQETLNTIFTSTLSIPGSDGLYGYGWIISQQSGHRFIEHSGNVYGFVSDLVRYPDDRVTIIVLSNTDWEKPDEISRNLAAIVLNEK